MFENDYHKKFSFLPDIRKKSNDNCVILKNSIYKDTELLEATYDKFFSLTNQPPKSESVKLSSSYKAHRNSIKNNSANPRATPLYYKWDTKEMPQIKIKKASEVPISSIETPSERKKRLIFEQKMILDRKDLEHSLKSMRSYENLTHSTNTMNQILERELRMKNADSSQEIHCIDPWTSSNLKDINLKNEIINKFYSMDNRRIRFYQKERDPEFFKFSRNQSNEKFASSSKQSLDFGEKN